MRISRIIDPRMHDLGAGFLVRRILPFHAHKSVGPFVFFDHFGPTEYSPGSTFDVRPHPHIGLATVTFLFDGAIRHRDSLGTDLVIEPGAVNWMTAGRGIVHSERTPDTQRENGQNLHGLQTWVALPRDEEDSAPTFVHHSADTLPEFLVDNVTVKVLAGTAWDKTSPVSFPWPIIYVALEATSESEIVLPGDLALERALYVVEGALQARDTSIEQHNMAILGNQTGVSITATEDSLIALVGGEPLGKRYIEWNFVSSRKERIDQAKADWKAGRFPKVPGDEEEFIPMPE